MSPQIDESAPDFAEEEECRICRESQSVERPLKSPCKCSGSVRFVHEDCLRVWLQTTGQSRCELCGTPYRFQPIYRTDAPATLSFMDVAWSLGDLALQGLAWFMRALLVTTIWLLLVPYCTWAVWHIGFSRSWSELEEIKNLESFSSVLIRLCSGSVLCVFIFLAFLGLNAIQEHAREETNRLVQSFGVLRSADSGESSRLMDTSRDSASSRPYLFSGDTVGDRTFPSAAALAPLSLTGDVFLRNASHTGSIDINEAVDLHQVDATISAAATARRVQGTEPTPSGFFSIFEHDNNEDLSVQEALGLRGPLINVVTNTVIVLMSNALVIDVFVVSPLFLGRFGVVKGVHGLRKLTIMVRGDTPMKRSLATTLLVSARASWMNFLGVSVSVSGMPNLVYICLGYLFFICITATCLFTLRKMDEARRFIRAFRLKNAYWIIAFTHVVARTILVMLVEFIILPLLFGMAVDLFALPSGTLSAKARLHAVTALSARRLLTHWALGIFYISALSIFIGVLREVLHPHLFCFLRDPNDPDFDPLKEIVTKPLAYHLRRLSLSVLLYAPVIGVTVYVPMQIVRALRSEFFPLRFVSSFGFVGDIVFYVIALGFVIPNLVRALALRSVLQEGFRLWFYHSSGLLRLQHLVLREDMQRRELPDQLQEDSLRRCDHTRQEDHFLALRILVLTALTIALVVGSISLVLVIPLEFARSGYARMQTMLGRDLGEISDAVLFLSGFTIICMSVSALRALRRGLQCGDFTAFLIAAAESTLRALGITSASALWFVLLPYLLGRITELSLALTDWRSVGNYALICGVQTWIRGFVLQRALTPILFHSVVSEPNRGVSFSEYILPERFLARHSAETSRFLWELVHICVFTACFAVLPPLVHSFLGDEYIQSWLFGLLRIIYIVMQLSILWLLGRGRLHDLHRFLAEQIRNKRYLVTMRLLDFSERSHMHQE